MKKITLLIAIIALGFTACKTAKYPELADGIYADIQTSKGPILVELNFTDTPVTTANFIGLAKGTHPQLVDSLQGKPFYDGFIFHRVMENFMIQTGDPLGTGMGDAGYKFDDEIVKTLNHNEAGTLAMANSGPDTSGSQFYITHVPYPSLNGRYTVFGKVVINPAKEKELRAQISDTVALKKAIDSVRMATVNIIAKVPVLKTPDAMNKPVDEITMESVEIIRIGSDAKAFDEVKVFSGQYAEKAKAIEKAKEITAKTLAKFAEQKAKATELPSGLKYYISEKGTGAKLSATSTVEAYYAVYFAADGKLLQTNNLATAEALDAVDAQQKAANAYKPMETEIGPDAPMIAGFREGLQQLSVGDKATLFLPSHLAYGERGNRGIPPNSDLVFEIEIVSEVIK
ncbi:putative peptidyl-prolyl cis-trans isomerase [Kordia antarctica]|uniref:peptidylprolyl isomerase n=1 Tax=Kordia antarctica TaxID=1218801 RepID=A0A7L4ZQU8_9FLAO|nr:peptidylprolyl isomerase [Kordia antarctica]QHI39025.1 putative peptidyl-prolyl cis-trans isomerase [Kordia antarctica]